MIRPILPPGSSADPFYTPRSPFCRVLRLPSEEKKAAHHGVAVPAAPNSDAQPAPGTRGLPLHPPARPPTALWQPDEPVLLSLVLPLHRV